MTLNSTVPFQWDNSHERDVGKLQSRLRSLQTWYQTMNLHLYHVYLYMFYLVLKFKTMYPLNVEIFGIEDSTCAVLL